MSFFTILGFPPVILTLSQALVIKIAAIGKISLRFFEFPIDILPIMCYTINIQEKWGDTL